MELLDEVQVKAINIANGKDLPEIPTLMFEFIGTGKWDPCSLNIFCFYLFLAKCNFKLKQPLSLSLLNLLIVHLEAFP